MPIFWIADYKELAKPLRMPPDGLTWRRLEDGAWELRSTTKAISSLEQKDEHRKQHEEDKMEEEEEEEKEKEEQGES